MMVFGGASVLCKHPRLHVSFTRWPRRLLCNKSGGLQETSGVGWYGIERLRSQEAFESWRKDVEHECTLLRGLIGTKSWEELTPRKYVQLLDGISSRLCLLLDTAEVCSNSHNDPVIRQAAMSTYSRLSMFVTKLNMDPILYSPLVEIVRDKDKFEALTVEEKRVAVALQLEFERDGIHLTKEEKEVIEHLQSKLREIEVAFMQMERRVSGEVRLSLKESGKLLMEARGLHRLGSLDTGTIPPEYVFPVDMTILNTVLRYCSDGEIRKKFYVAAHSGAMHENLGVLNSLMMVRRVLANTLGFETYAHLVTSYRMASNPDTVIKFLDDLSEKVRGKALAEFGLLREQKLVHEGTSDMYVWDIPYYSNLVLNSAFDEGTLAEVSDYFSLEGCLQGLKHICGELFGLKFEEQHPMNPSEQWAPNVRKWVVREENGDLAGTLYLDLYQRPGKFQNPAHFQVRCSHRNHKVEYFEQTGNEAQDRNDPYELPSSVLLCNFDPASTLRLQHVQVVTLFHEFGHALHSLLSRTELQHLSGTRGELDFVETPSQLMEYFCFDDRVLQTFARHHTTKAPIPKTLVNSLNQARNMFQAMELEQQILFAACDQILFGTRTELDLVKDQTALNHILTELSTKYSRVEHVQGTFWLGRFSHFVNYGAAYYSYTYARAFASDLWQTCFREDPLSRQVGEKYRQNILSNGGSKSPHEMLQTMLGRPLKLEMLVQEISNRPS